MRASTFPETVRPQGGGEHYRRLIRTRTDTAGPPIFHVAGKVGRGPFVVATVDPDAPKPQSPSLAQIRHFLGGNFYLNCAGRLVNSTPAVSEFLQPAPPPGSDAHRYVVFHAMFDLPREC
jgi:phosphatidylethanolamine-binding protein (PEBP) family uncharacterized protein